MKDHERRELVSLLASVARDYGQTEQLRERIAEVLLPVIYAEEAKLRDMTAFANSLLAPDGVSLVPDGPHDLFDWGAVDDDLLAALRPGLIVPGTTRDDSVIAELRTLLRRVYERDSRFMRP